MFWRPALFVGLLLYSLTSEAWQISIHHKPHAPLIPNELYHKLFDSIANRPSGRKLMKQLYFGDCCEGSENDHLLFNGDLQPIYPLWNEGEYYIDILVGSPESRTSFRVQIDTGSADLGLPEKGCTGCRRHFDKRYNHANATLIDCEPDFPPHTICPVCLTPDNQCSYDITYADNSGFSAELWLDQVALGHQEFHTNSTFAAIGGIYEIKGATEPYSIDGIIGFAYSKEVSETGAPTPYEALVSAKIIEHDQFGMCFNPNGGALDLGLIGNHSFGSDFVYTKLIAQDYYTVNLTDIRVNNVSIGITPHLYNHNEAIVDSGSTTITLPSKAFTALKDTFLRLCDNNPQSSQLVGVCIDEAGDPLSKSDTIFDDYNCFKLTETQTEAYPVISFVFPAAQKASTPQLTVPDEIWIELHPHVYLRNRSIFCDHGWSGIGIDGADGDGTILGDVFMEPFYTLFDRTNELVGFAQLNQPC